MIACQIDDKRQRADCETDKREKPDAGTPGRGDAALPEMREQEKEGKEGEAESPLRVGLCSDGDRRAARYGKAGALPPRDVAPEYVVARAQQPVSPRRIRQGHQK